MNIVSVMFASPAYDALVALRLRTLYQPLGASIQIEDFAQEYQDVHLAVYNDTMEIIGGFVAKVCKEGEEGTLHKRKICLLKQVVVETAHQGKGVGRDMIAALEQLLIDKGYKEVRLYAHVGALDFYSKLGYTKHGKEFTGNEIRQHVMKKKLQRRSDRLDVLQSVGAAYQ